MPAGTSPYGSAAYLPPSIVPPPPPPPPPPARDYIPSEPSGTREVYDQYSGYSYV